MEDSRRNRMTGSLGLANIFGSAENAGRRAVDRPLAEGMLNFSTIMQLFSPGQAA